MSTANLASNLLASEQGLAAVIRQAAATIDDVGLHLAPALVRLQASVGLAKHRMREASDQVRQAMADLTLFAETTALDLLGAIDVPMLTATLPSLEQRHASEAHEDELAAQAACRGVQPPAESRARVPLSRPLTAEASSVDLPKTTSDWLEGMVGWAKQEMAPPVEDDDEEQPEPEGEPTPAEPPVDSEGGEMLAPPLADEDDEKAADAILGVAPAGFHAMRGVAEAIIDEKASDRPGALPPEFQSALNDTTQQVVNDPPPPAKKARGKRKR